MLAEHFVQANLCSKLQTALTGGNKGALCNLCLQTNHPGSYTPPLLPAAISPPGSALGETVTKTPSSLNTYHKGLLFK